MNPSESAEPPKSNPFAPLLGIVGGIIGGVVGYFAFFWLAHQGFYALALPGALIGVGAGLPGKSRSLPINIICGVAALCLGIFTEWRFAPFIKDESFSYFLSHLQDLRPISLIMIGIGAFVGFWFPYSKR